MNLDSFVNMVHNERKFKVWIKQIYKMIEYGDFASKYVKLIVWEQTPFPSFEFVGLLFRHIATKHDIL